MNTISNARKNWNDGMSTSAMVSLSSKGPTRFAAMVLLGTILSACGTTKNDTYDLAISANATGPSLRSKQILVPQPTALSAIDSDQIIIRVSPTEIQYLAKSQWSDKLSRMVQAKLVEAFENSGKVGGVGTPGQGLAIDDQVVTDIRTFEVDLGGRRQATVEISAKILNDKNGTVRALKVFRHTAPIAGSTNQDYVKALDRAFSSVTSDIVSWTLASLS